LIDYQNKTLDIQDLPKFETVEGHPVDKAYLKVLRLMYSFWLILSFSGLFVTNYFTDIPSLVFYSILIVLGLIFLFSIIETEKGFPKRKFGIREKDIIFQKGYFFFRQTIVPFKRIQHVEVKQDLIFRAFGIYSLKLFTAGSSTGDLSIVGLNKTDADKLKAIILKAASVDED
jgi:membrane protein YdbS with pleckstrin-like domain